MLNWLKQNIIVSVILFTIFFLIMPVIIIHILFKLPAIHPFFESEWSAGDIIISFFALLSFIGTITLGGLALYQNKSLNEINKDLTQHQYKPVITVSPLIDENDKKEKLRTYYRTVERNKTGLLVNHGWSTHETYYPYAKLCFRNIGLGPAINVHLYWYNLDSVRGIQDIDEISEKNIENFYERVQYSNFKYVEGDKEKSEPWMLFTEFDLGVTEESNRLNLYLSFENNVKKLHSIIEIQYENVLGSKYKKMLYLGFDEYPTLLPISKDYKITDKEMEKTV